MHTICFNTNFGWMSVSGDDCGISAITFGRKEDTGEPDKLLLEAKEQLREYFAGKRTSFNMQLNLVGTEFQKKVWDKLQNVEYGKTASYKDIAKAVGCPKGSRAVGRAVGSNPVAIVVPCHRIIGSSGRLTGYYYGLEVKKRLLELEGRHVL